MAQKRTDEQHMREALALALNGTGHVSPNPRVGCVITRDGKIIGKGWHHRYGERHAEVDAVADAGGEVSGATVYVTLEPCCHYGHTPPCAQMLVAHGVSRVVAGMSDPNPIVHSKGLEILKEAGIEVECRVLEDECKWMNRGFIRAMTLRRPWVTIKSAITLDGNISLADGSSKWITGPDAREKTHLLRAESDALLTGVGTIIADDPQLTVRDAPGRTPLRVVLDRTLRTPDGARIFGTGPLLFMASPSAPEDRIKLFRDKGADVEIIDAPHGKTIEPVLRKLCEKGINYLMVEAGSHVTSSFMQSGLADEVSMFIAPKFIGRGVRCTEEMNIASLDAAVSLRETRVTKCGPDIWLEGVLSCSPDL